MTLIQPPYPQISRMTLPNTMAFVPQARTIPGQLQPDSLSIRFGATENAQAVTDPLDFVDSLKKRGMVVAGGGGTMGNGIALNHLNIGVPVRIIEGNDAYYQNALKKFDTELAAAVKRGLMTQEEADKTRALVKGGFTNDTLTNLPKDTGLVIEAIFENPDIKKALFQKLDAHLGPEAILASNTSSISIDKLAEGLRYPERFIGIHFFMPAHKNRFIEIIPGKKTSQETINKTMALVKALGKTPIVCKRDSAGFAVNRMLVPWMVEGTRILEDMVKEHKTKTGQDPTAQEMKQFVTTIDFAARDLVWPTVSKNPKTSAILLSPFVAYNSPIYMGIIAEISEILYRDFGDSYKPTQTLVEKAAQFAALKKENPPNFEERFKALQYPLGGPEDVLKDKVQAAKDRFAGLMIGISTQLIDEDITTPEDMNRGMLLGTRWEVSLFEMINQIGTPKALELVRKYKETNPDFKVSETLTTMAAANKSFDLNYVDTRKDGATQYITLNKPQRNNAFDIGMLKAMEAAFDQAEADPTVKSIVFESIGGKHFASGMDIFNLKSELVQVDADIRAKYGKAPESVFRQKMDEAVLSHVKKIFQPGIDLFDKIRASSKITVSKVNGTCFGGAAELAMSCDYIAASNDAVFGFPEVKYGLFPAWTGTENLPERVGPTMAKFMILEGGLMDNKGKCTAFLNGKEAALIGLANLSAPAGELEKAVKEKLVEWENGAKTVFPQSPSTLASLDNRVREKLATQAPTNPLAARLLNRFDTYRNVTAENALDTELKPLLAPIQQKKAEVKQQLDSTRDAMAALDNNALGGTAAQVAERDAAREKFIALDQTFQKLEKAEALARKLYNVGINLSVNRLTSDVNENKTEAVRNRDFEAMVLNMMAVDELARQMKPGK